MNIKYALKAILSNKFLSIVLIIELVCGYYSFYNILDFQKQINEETKKISFVYGNKSIYKMTLNSFGTIAFKDSERAIDCIKELQKAKEYTFTIGNQTQISIKTFHHYYKFKMPSMPINIIKNVQYVSVNAFDTNENGVKSFNLELQEGRLFNKDEYSKGTEDNIYPIILGANYKGYYKVGDIIEGFRLEENVTIKFRVIGILKKDTNIPIKFDNTNIFCQSEKANPNLVNLDDYALKPFITDTSEISGEEIQSDMLGNFVILNKSYSEEKKEKILNDIKNKLESATEEKFIITSYDKVITKQLDQYVNSRNTYLYTTITVLIFLSITIIVSMLSSINKRKKEFGVYFSSGASMKDIMIMVCLQMVIISVIALIFTAIAILIYYNFFDGDALLKDINIQTKSLDFKILAVLLLGGVTYSALVSLIPIRKLKKLNISELLRRDD